RDQEIVVRPSDRSLAEIVQSDPKLESSFNHYVTLTGRLSASTNFPGYFELRRGEDFVLVTYPDDYTYYKLETMVGSGEIAVTMKGFLFDYDVDDDVWYLLWTGLDLTETAPEYTDEQKAQLIAEWLTDQVAGSIPGNGTLSLPTADPDFGGTITYTVSGPNAGLVDLVNQTVQAVLEPTNVEAHATIVIGSVTRVLDFTWTIVPAVAEGSWMWIEDLITEAPSVGVWISGTVLAAYEGEDGTTVLIEDPTGRLSVTLPSTEWFYGGYVMVGEILDAYGFLSRDSGSWEFRATEYGFSPGSDSLSETFDPLTLGQLDAIDIDDPSQIGKAVETVGLLRKNADGTLVLAGHGIEIAILSCYAESNFLNEWIGFPLRLRGFYAGLETSGTG
ncbi:MAG TPA: hypothetical protein PLZ76_07940, partial [Bacillota bacterium]|nr:hypothetical protein [Bacillota bacterium]